MPIDLSRAVPETLAQAAKLGELLDVVRAIEVWRDREAEVLDYVYRERLIRLIREHAPAEELRAFHEHLGRVAHPRRRDALDGLSKPYFARWSAYRDVLENRIAALTSEAPRQVLQRAHVQEILRLVATGAADSQKALGDILGLSKTNLTRVLQLMEANELIERRQVGREKRLVPGVHGLDALAEAAPAQERPVGWGALLSGAAAEDPLGTDRRIRRAAAA